MILPSILRKYVGSSIQAQIQDLRATSCSFVVTHKFPDGNFARPRLADFAFLCQISRENKINAPALPSTKISQADGIFSSCERYRT